ncbi:hypothetical protein [Breznakiella homolactica]|uniref:Uncharacterized protein n=1 Tax=Breznakiella homolactica TaxID=2798577 RepID=A0A7T8B951_9SPIR|nr:hypothetical protein [Breznakiella homolactica]QQO07580.1 hypothetical protein JFL75_11545 [Breznakiella homolactica]
MDTLQNLAEELKDRIALIPGLMNPALSSRPGKTELAFTPKRKALSEDGLSAKASSGWPLHIAGKDIYGIGIRKRADRHGAEVISEPFDGLIWNLHAGGTLRFDLAALVPGDWNHVLFQTFHEINYREYTAASATDSWYFENDDGENRNGFNYYANVMLGYRMPVFLNMAALMAEVDMYLYDTPGRELWGDDLGRWVFSGLLNFKITDRLSAAAIVQFRTRRNFTTETREYEFYQDRRLVTSGAKQRLEFYQVAFRLTFKLK